MKVIQIHLKTFYFDANQRCHPDAWFDFSEIKYKKRFYSKEHKSIFYYINNDVGNLRLSKGVLLLDDGVKYLPLDLELLPKDFEIDINVNIKDVFLQPARVIKFTIKGKDIEIWKD